MERKSGSSAACLERRTDWERCLQAGHLEGFCFRSCRERGRAAPEARSWWKKALGVFMRAGEGAIEREWGDYFYT